MVITRAGESKGRCRFCNKSFRSNVRLQAHEAMHLADGQERDDEEDRILHCDPGDGTAPEAVTTVAIDGQGDSYLVISMDN